MKKEDKLPGGLGDKKSPFDFETEQVLKGMTVEMEHTNDPLIALEIALDHLTEDKEYYDKLETIHHDNITEDITPQALDSVIKKHAQGNTLAGNEFLKQLVMQLTQGTKHTEDDLDLMLRKYSAYKQKSKVPVREPAKQAPPLGLSPSQWQKTTGLPKEPGKMGKFAQNVWQKLKGQKPGEAPSQPAAASAPAKPAPTKYTTPPPATKQPEKEIPSLAQLAQQAVSEPQVDPHQFKKQDQPHLAVQKPKTDPSLPELPDLPDLPADVPPPKKPPQKAKTPSLPTLSKLAKEPTAKDHGKEKEAPLPAKVSRGGEPSKDDKDVAPSEPTPKSVKQKEKPKSTPLPTTEPSSWEDIEQAPIDPDKEVEKVAPTLSKLSKAKYGTTQPFEYQHLWKAGDKVNMGKAGVGTVVKKVGHKWFLKGSDGRVYSYSTHPSSSQKVRPVKDQQTKPEAKPEAKPETKPEAKPETKPEAKPEPKAKTKPDLSSLSMQLLRNTIKKGKAKHKSNDYNNFADKLQKEVEAGNVEPEQAEKFLKTPHWEKTYKELEEKGYDSKNKPQKPEPKIVPQKEKEKKIYKKGQKLNLQPVGEVEIIGQSGRGLLVQQGNKRWYYRPQDKILRPMKG